MDLLARREHSRLELRRKLSRRYADENLEAVLDTLAEEGLQSDVRFAEGFARDKALRGIGPLRIERELLERGVSGSVAGNALRTLVDEEGVQWRLVARDALTKKFGDANMPEVFEERARRLRFLQYRGFGSEDFAVEVE